MRIYEVDMPSWGKQPWQNIEIETAEQLENFLRLVGSNCKSYLEQVKQAGTFLYRGSNSWPSMAGVSASRPGRIPSDSETQAQELFDWFLVKMGFSALRSNSIFTISDKSWASQFGTPYIIFPIHGKSSFTYCEEQDASLSMGDVADMDLPMWNRYKLAVQRSLDKTKYTPTIYHIKTILKTDMPWLLMQELKSNKQQLIAAGFNKTIFEKQWQEFYSLRSFEERWNPHDENLAGALKNKWEVYVTGEYYALHYRFETKVKQYLAIA
jgi:hypothetical protein